MAPSNRAAAMITIVNVLFMLCFLSCWCLSLRFGDWLGNQELYGCALGVLGEAAQKFGGVAVGLDDAKAVGFEAVRDAVIPVIVGQADDLLGFCAVNVVGLLIEPGDRKSVV